jgi:hypothetical protein
MHFKSVNNDNKNRDKTLNNISLFDADMGGTELQRPVEIVLSFKFNSEYPISVFILTDGSISITERLFEYIKDNCSTTRIHSFGIKSGASRYLVEGVANKGNDAGRK